MAKSVDVELQPKDWCIVATESFLILLFINILVAVNNYNPSGFINFGIWFDILISSICPFGEMVCSVLFLPIFSKIARVISIRNTIVKIVIFSVVVFLLCLLIGGVGAMGFLFEEWSNLLDMISFVYHYAVIDIWKYIMIYALLMMLKIKKLEKCHAKKSGAHNN